MRVGVGVLVGVAVLLGCEGVARACSGSDCHPAQTVPGDGASMPANAAGIAWYSDTADVDAVVLLDVEQGVEIPVTATPMGIVDALAPAQELEPDKDYRFELPPSFCDPDVPLIRSFHTGPAVELPSSKLGTLIVAAPELTQIPVPASPSCTGNVSAVSVRIEVELDPLAVPLAESLMYETWVDGVRWEHATSLFEAPFVGASWVGRGVDEIFEACPNSGSEGPITHEVQMRAWAPGLPGVVLESDVVEVVLECEGPGDTQTGDEDDMSDTGSFVAEHEPLDERGGCACNSTSGSPGTGSGALVLLVLLGRRRRITARAQPC